MNPLPTVGLKTLIIFGLSFAKQLAHGLVKRFAGYVTLLNAFVLNCRFFYHTSPSKSNPTTNIIRDLKLKNYF